jgi:hypothetical protein
MKYKGLSLLTTMLLLGSFSAFGGQSEKEHIDETGGFRLSLLSDWRAVSYSDAVGRQKTEFVYRDRSEGLLKVSKQSLNGSLADMVKREEDTLRLYRAGFERASSELFGGGELDGYRLSFYTADGGRQTASTFYFLRDKETVWVLRFTGKRGTIDAIRNVTDRLARSFQPVQK